MSMSMHNFRAVQSLKAVVCLNLFAKESIEVLIFNSWPGELLEVNRMTPERALVVAKELSNPSTEELSLVNCACRQLLAMSLFDAVNCIKARLN